MDCCAYDGLQTVFFGSEITFSSLNNEKLNLLRLTDESIKIIIVCHWPAVGIKASDNPESWSVS